FIANVGMRPIFRRFLSHVGDGGILRSRDGHARSREARHRLADDRRNVDDRASGWAGDRFGLPDGLVDRYGRGRLIDGIDLTRSEIAVARAVTPKRPVP